MVVSDMTLKIGAAAALAAGVVIGYYFGRPRQLKNAFVLVVRFKLKPGKRQEFLDAWAKLAKHCYAKEPNTVTYEAAISPADPSTVMIYERYPSKADLENPHKTSAVFKQLGAEIGGLFETVDYEEYIETNLGYVVR